MAKNIPKNNSRFHMRRNKYITGKYKKSKYDPYVKLTVTIWSQWDSIEAERDKLKIDAKSSIHKFVYHAYENQPSIRNDICGVIEDAWRTNSTIEARIKLDKDKIDFANIKQYKPIIGGSTGNNILTITGLSVYL